VTLSGDAAKRVADLCFWLEGQTTVDASVRMGGLAKPVVELTLDEDACGAKRSTLHLRSGAIVAVRLVEE
jgi:hypothetical protein